MKLHLPLKLRGALLAVLMLPAQAALIWNSGNWDDSSPSWIENGAAAVFSPGLDVEFAAAGEKTVNITGPVEPGSVLVSASGYVFTGNGSVGGIGVLTLSDGASLTVQNSNSFTGGTVVNTGAVLTLNQPGSVGTVNGGEAAFGAVSGDGMVVVSLETRETRASIQGDSWQSMTGTLRVQQGNLGLGRNPAHGGAGRAAVLGAGQVEVASAGQFLTTFGGGVAGLVTNNSFNSNIRTEAGAVLGNRDGHVNWTGDVALNLQSLAAETPSYNNSGSTEMALYYAKYVVWNGVVSGAGELMLTSGNADTGGDHRVVLTNSGNSFTGTYRVNGAYLTTLALAESAAAANATVQLDTATSRLVLMNSDAELAALNGTAGVVLAEGSGARMLTVGGGTFSGQVQDSASAVAGLSLGIVKTGAGALNLVGPGCAYTGDTVVQGGSVNFSGDTSLGNIRVAGGSLLSTTGNLTLRSGAGLSLDMVALGAASVQVGGGLNLSDSTHRVEVSGYENLAQGRYDLVTWTTATAVSSADFLPSGLNDTATLTYSVQVQGNSLQLVVGSMADVSWLWNAGSATWEDNSVAQWLNTSGSGPAGQQVTFGPNNAGTVTLNRVTPAGIRVTGGNYTFVAGGENPGGIVSAGNLSISGAETVLHLNLANPSFSGRTELLGGTLELGATGALGTSSLLFNGGLLRYGSGIVQDLSAQVHADSSAPVRIDTNGNNVTWADVDGVKQTLSCGVEKNGEGEFSLNWAGSNTSHSGTLTVNGGTLRVSKLTGQGTLAGGFAGSGTLVLESPSGQLTVQGDSSSFAGTLRLSGNGSSNTGSVSFANGASIGGADTLVQVAGLRFWFQANNSTVAADMEIVEGTTTYMDGSSGNTYHFTGSISGSGNLIVKPAPNITMSGDVSGFAGQFQHPGSRAVTWLFGGSGVTGNGLVQADLSSTGAQMSYVFQYSGDTVLSGAVSGAANLRQSGSGVLTLTGQSTTTGNLVVDENSQIRLGDASTPGSWAGASQLGRGQLTLVNGSLENGLTTMEGTLVADVAADALVNMGGMDANVLQSIAIGAGGQLGGIAGALHIGPADGVGSMRLTLGAENVGASAVPASGEEAMLSITGGNLVIHDSAAVELNLETVREILLGRRQAVYLHIADTPLELAGGLSVASLFANSSTTPESLGLVVLGVEAGNIVLEGDVRDVYMVMENGDYPTVTDYTRLQPYKATYVDAGYTLALNLPGDDAQVAWVNNLLGSGDFSVSNTDAGSGVLRVLLNNEVLGQVESGLTPEQDAEINSANTLFAGNVTAGHGVQLVKTGSGTLTVGGRLTADSLELDDGTLRLTGAVSRIHSLAGDSALVLDGGLEITGDSLSFSGDLSGSGMLELNGRLAGRGGIGALAGAGELVSAGETFTVQNTADATFSGSLTGGDDRGVLSVLPGPGVFTMSRVSTSDSWSVQNSGNLVLNQAGADGNTHLTLQDLQLLDGSATTLVLNTDADMQVFSLGSLLVQDGAAVTLQSTGSLPLEVSEQGTVVLGQVGEAGLGADDRVLLTLGSGTPFRDIVSAWLSVQNGDLLLNIRRDDTNKYAILATSANGETGAQMLWKLPNAVLSTHPGLKALTQALDDMVDSGDSGRADRVLSAAAGAGAAVLGSALAGDIERQLKAIRNRTTTMGVNPAFEYDFPLFNAWVNAEGDRRELSASGTDAGYTLSSWGATVGADADINTHLTAGLAFTAMYGDLQGRSPDHAHGDVDSYYLALFGRYTVSRWTHTMVGAIGWSDVELKRRVDFGSGGYSTSGSTDAMSFGLLYELGYVIPLDEDGVSCLQPIANVSYRHVGLDAYDERGSDGALHIGRQDMDIVTFGLGARAQTYALENVYNRSCLLEGRVLLKLDAGDTRSHSEISLLADRRRGGRVRSAENGRFGVELGAGITVPLGAESGSLFLDGSVEWWRDESAINGTAGYRLSF